MLRLFYSLLVILLPNFSSYLGSYKVFIVVHLESVQCICREGELLKDQTGSSG